MTPRERQLSGGRAISGDDSPARTVLTCGGAPYQVAGETNGGVTKRYAGGGGKGEWYQGAPAPWTPGFEHTKSANRPTGVETVGALGASELVAHLAVRRSRSSIQAISTAAACTSSERSRRGSV